MTDLVSGGDSPECPASSKSENQVSLERRPYALDWVHDLATAPLKRGKNLLELTSFRGVSLWWLVYFPFLNAATAYAESVKSGRPTAAYHPLLVRLRKSLRHLVPLYALLVTAVCRLNARLYSARREPDQAIVMFTAQNIEWRKFADPVHGKTRKTDVFFDPILREMRKTGKYGIRSTYPIGNPVVGLPVAIEKRLHQPDIVHIPFEAFWSLSATVVERQLRRRMAKLWIELERDDVFAKRLNYRGLHLLKALRTDIEELFKHEIPRAAVNLLTAEKMIEKENPCLIILQNEYGRWERTVIAAAKSKGVPTLAIQHGTIGPAHIGYYHKADEEAGKAEAFPIPDMTVVFGEYARKVLIETCNYPPERVVALGNHQYDYVPSFLSRLSTESRNRTCRELGLDPARRIVLVATGALQSRYGYPDHDRLLLDAIYSAKLLRPELQLVVKLHPKEDGALQQMMALERGLDDVVVIRGHVAKLLWASDVLVTIHSAIAMEAIALRKPVITVNLTGVPDLYPYAQSGAAVGVYRQEDLLAVLNAVFEDPQTIDRLDEGRRRFIRDHLSGLDGRSSFRIAQLITRLANR